MSQSETMPETGGAAAPKPSIWGMIWSPGEQFDRMRERPRIWGGLIPVTLLFAIAMAAASLLTPDAVFEEAGLELTAEQLATAKMWTAVGNGVFFLIVMPILFVIGAAIFLLITALARTGATFKHLFSMTVYTAFISAIGLLLNSFLTWLLGTDFDVTVTSLGSVVNAEGKMGALLNGIEVFTIWATVLAAIGLHKVGGLSKGVAWTIAVIFFLIGIFILVVMQPAAGMAGV